MTDFLVKEFSRCLDSISKADLGTPEYFNALQALSLLDGMGDQINAAVELVNGNAVDPADEDQQVIQFPLHPVSAPDPEPEEEPAPVEPEPVAPAPAPAPTYTKADVRKALYNAKSNGINLQELFAQYGATNTNDLPASAYAEIVALYGDEC